MGRKLPNVLEPDELKALLAVPNVRCPTGLRNRVMLELMAHAGLRVSEVTKLKSGHICWRDGLVTVRDGKGGSDRVVPVRADVMDWLQRWREKRPNVRTAFFTTLSGGVVSCRYIQSMVSRCAEKAGLPEERRVSPHTLRHTFATAMLDDGFNIREVQSLLGHANVNTTMIYTHVKPTDLAAKVQGRSTNRELLELAEKLRGLPDDVKKSLAKILE